ncbi:MAG: Clp1/GlmU family protein [Candidatus Hydromicrobium sp.]
MKFFNSTQELLEILSNKKGIIFLLGQTDTGKTTFAKELIKRYLEKNKKVAFIDSDVGQSTIGPPTTIGLKLIKCNEDAHNNNYSNLYFVGSTSPRGYFLPMVIGTYKLSQIFLKSVYSTIIDTTGLVLGDYGQNLKFYKINLILPGYLVIFEKEDELKPYREMFKNNKKIKTFIIKIKGDIKERSYAQREEYRGEKFREYFKKGKEQILNLGELSSFPPIVEFKSRIQKFNVLGLEDEYNKLLGIGIFLDFEQNENIKIYTPITNIKKVSFLKLGSIKITKEGKKII